MLWVPVAATTLGSWVRIPFYTYMHVCFFVCFAVLYRLSLVMGRSSVQGDLPQHLKGYTEDSSEWEQARGPNP
jgi:hypothetical protein